MTESGDHQANPTTCGTAEAHVEQQLIPGIPDEITLGQISSKFPRKEIDNTLLLVSRGWCHAIRSRQIHDARARSKSTEPFVLSNHRPRVPPGTWEIVDDNIPEDQMTVWNIIDKRSNLQLPPIPSNCFDTIIPGWGRCATLDGRVYVFGGLDCKVYVLDVAGHRQWKQCASMLMPKHEFGCGAIDGKIYVFGGAVYHECMWGSLVYNPMQDRWSAIRPIAGLRCGDHIAGVKREFAMHLEPDFYLNHNRRWWCRHIPVYDQLNADLLEVYDPLKDEWRVVAPVGSPKEKPFVAGKKFYSMIQLGIYVYDFHINSWVRRHSFSCAAFGLADPVELWPLGMLTDDGKLLALFDWPTSDRGTNRSCLMRSRGLRSQGNEIAWERADFSIPLGEASPVAITHVVAKNPIVL